jgi:SAM-dependent methyltransferase
VNRFLTFLTDIITDVNYTDMETCYKAVRTKLLKSIPLRSNGFDLEPEISIKLAKRGAHIFEVPINYSGRTREEGKKIRWKDGFSALAALIKYSVIDDIYKEDEYGSHILESMSHAPNFAKWMADEIMPYVGRKVLEVGAGIGNLTRYFVPRIKYTASDINENYLSYLNNYCKNKPYLEIKKVDITKTEDFLEIKGRYDTVICLNVLEHVNDDIKALKNLHSSLEIGGKIIVLVPQHEWLYSSLDEALGHLRRYSKGRLEGNMREAGFEVERTIVSFNKIGVLSWILNGKIMKRKHFSKIQIKILNIFTWVFRLINPILPWKGLSVIVIGVKNG